MPHENRFKKPFQFGPESITRRLTDSTEPGRGCGFRLRVLALAVEHL